MIVANTIAEVMMLPRPVETLAELSGAMGLTSERVRQLEREALARLRAFLRAGVA